MSLVRSYPLARGLAAHAALVALAGLALAPQIALVADGGWPATHEKLRYLVLVDLFTDAVRHGIAYPRFLPDLYGGYGYPLFCFYQPGFFWFAVPFALLPLPLHVGLTLALWACLALGALGAFRLARELAAWQAGAATPGSDAEMAGSGWGLFAAAWLLLTPYLHLDLYVRGDLSELAGVLAGPWAVFAVLRLARRVARREPTSAASLGAAGALSALIVLHPAPALGMLPALATLGAVLAAGRPYAGRLALRLVAVFGLALVVTSPYWLTLAMLRPYVGFDRLVEGYYQPERHGLALAQLFERRWAYGGSRPGFEDPASFQLGALHFAAASLGAWLGRRVRAVVAAYAGYLLLLALCLDAASGFWAHAGPLRFLQFPWRLLATTTTLQLVAALGLAGAPAALARLARGRPPEALRFAAGAGAALLVAAGFAWYAPQLQVFGSSDPRFGPEHFHAARKHRVFEMFGEKAEYLPRTARRAPAAPRDFAIPPVRLVPAGLVVQQEGADAYRIDVELRADAAGSVAILEQLYLPGWQVRLDGELVPRAVLEASLGPEGFPRIPIPDLAPHRLRARYAAPSPWQLWFEAHGRASHHPAGSLQRR